MKRSGGAGPQMADAKRRSPSTSTSSPAALLRGFEVGARQPHRWRHTEHGEHRHQPADDQKSKKLRTSLSAKLLPRYSCAEQIELGFAGSEPTVIAAMDVASS